MSHSSYSLRALSKPTTNLHERKPNHMGNWRRMAEPLTWKRIQQWDNELYILRGAQWYISQIIWASVIGMSFKQSIAVLTVANTETASKISKLLAIKDISNHAISLALIQAATLTTSNNTSSVLQLDYVNVFANFWRVLIPVLKQSHTWPRCWRIPRASNKSGTAMALGSAIKRAVMPHIVK